MGRCYQSSKYEQLVLLYFEDISDESILENFLIALKLIFQLLERALEECGDDLDLAIRSLNQLHLGYNDRNLGNASNSSDVALEANIQPQSQGLYFMSTELNLALNNYILNALLLPLQGIVSILRLRVHKRRFLYFVHL